MGMWGALVPARSADLGLNELLIAGFLLIVGLRPVGSGPIADAMTLDA